MSLAHLASRLLFGLTYKAHDVPFNRSATPPNPDVPVLFPLLPGPSLLAGLLGELNAEDKMTVTD